jgi:hypothetical protein
MCTTVIPAAMALSRSPSSVPDAPCKVMKTRVCSLIVRIRSMSNRFFVSPATMLLSIPCILPTAGASVSILVSSTNCLASPGVVSPLRRSRAVSWISEPLPMSPISPSTRISGRIAFSVSTAVLVWRIFSSRGSVETSNTIQSNPAFAASMALARE